MTQHTANVVRALLSSHHGLKDKSSIWYDYEYNVGFGYFANECEYDSYVSEDLTTKTFEVEDLGVVLVEYHGARPRPDWHSGDYDPARYLLFRIGNRVFRQDGEYSSHGGSDNWDGAFTEVTEQTETVTQYKETTVTEKLSARDVESLIKGHEFINEYSWNGQTYTDSEHGWHWWEDEVSSSEKIEVAGLGTVQIVDRYAGHEGGAEDIFIVFEVDMADGSGKRWFRKTGYYASYVGSEWDGDFTEVAPEVRPKTYYEPVKG